MSFTTRERISHVVRRLGMGAQPRRAAQFSSVNDALAGMLDLSNPAPPLPEVPVPLTEDEAKDRSTVRSAFQFWLRQMLVGTRPLEERLVWFFHDHFPSSTTKARFPYVMWRQHVTLRRHATGSFADLLHAIAVDPAMLFYLDGTQNRVGAINENFGREVMELFTIGRGTYDEADVLAASQAFSGWVVAVPFRIDRMPPGVEAWDAVFVPFRHDGQEKTLLGNTGRFDASAAIDILLDHPATAENIATKLYTELVGLHPHPTTATRLGERFRGSYDILDLVSAIADDPIFISDEAIRTRIRTPLERALGIVQGFGAASGAGPHFIRELEEIGYLPLSPPNVAGFPTGERLLGPHQLVHAFDLAGLAATPDTELDARAVLARLGIYDASPSTIEVLERTPDGATRIALAANAPEYTVT